MSNTAVVFHGLVEGELEEILEHVEPSSFTVLGEVNETGDSYVGVEGDADHYLKALQHIARLAYEAGVDSEDASNAVGDAYGG